MPHQGVDAVVAASAIVKNLQSLVSGEISPLESAVVSVGIFEAGTRFNENSSRRAAGTVEKLLGKEAVVTQEKVTGGEDFAFFLEKAPGLFAFLGAWLCSLRAGDRNHP
jgi:metal-dependent amidase/aminoacylase/carboxypeptidase family protein